MTERKNWSSSSLVTDLVLTLFHVSFSFLNRLVTHVAVTLLVEWHQLCYHVIIHNAANKSLKMFVGEWGWRNNMSDRVNCQKLSSPLIATGWVHPCCFIFRSINVVFPVLFLEMCVYTRVLAVLRIVARASMLQTKERGNRKRGESSPSRVYLARSLARNHAWPRDTSSLFLYSPSKLLFLRSHFLSWLLLITIVVVFATRSTWNWLHGVV